MARCWAACLGDCSDKMSREHLVTKSMFTGGFVDIQGFPWCKEKPIRVGLASATAKILCKKHNSDLSVVDAAGKEGFDAIRKMMRLSNVRCKLKPRFWTTIKKFELDGCKLERWCLKTLINLCCDRGHAIGRDSSVEGQPSERLVRIAYGLEAFKGKAGLYLVARIGSNITAVEKIGFVPLFKHNLNVEGGIFTYYGFMLMIYLEEEGPPKPLTGIWMNDVHLGDATLSHHPPSINFTHGRFMSHKLVFRW